jgi:hypothetical protein
MSQLNLNLDESSPTLRPRTTQEKLGIALSLTGFFGALLAVTLYGLAGYQSSPVEEDTGPMVIFAGGDVAGQRDDVVATEALPADDEEVGSFGDPVADHYAEDELGDWGSSAVENSSGAAVEEHDDRASARANGRIRRGVGGQNTEF